MINRALHHAAIPVINLRYALFATLQSIFCLSKTPNVAATPGATSHYNGTNLLISQGPEFASGWCNPDVHISVSGAKCHNDRIYESASSIDGIGIEIGKDFTRVCRKRLRPN